MPTIRLSTRRIDGAPGVDFARSGMERARAIGDVGRQISGTIDRTLIIANRIKENDARIAATEWETAMMRGLNGTDVTDSAGKVTHIPGIAQKTWEDYRREGGDGSPIADLARIEEAFQATDTFRNMDSITRRKFDRLVALKREGYRRTVNGLHDRNRAAEDRFWDARAIQNADERLSLSFCEDDEAFEKTSAEVAKDKLAIAYKRMDLNDERVGVAWKKDYDAIRKDAALKRVAALAELGAQGDTKIIGGKIETGQADLDRASAYLAKMTESGRFSPKEASDLGFRIVQAQSRLDNRIQGEIERYKDAALVHAYDENGLAMLGEAEATLTMAAAGLRNGSAVQTAALGAAKKLGVAADQRVEYDIMSDLCDGKKLFMNDGKTPIYTPGSRQARLFPRVYEAFEKKQDAAFRKNHGHYQLEAETKMLDFAAAGNPQGYFSYLAQRVVDKKLTPGDFQRFKEKFRTGCLKGFKGAEGQMPRQQRLFGDLNTALKEAFGVDFTESVKRTSTGDVKFDAQGMPEYDENADAPDFEYARRDPDALYRRNYNRGLTTETISAEKMREAVNVALELAKYDGAELPPAKMPFDLTWMRPGADITKPHRIDAVADFKEFLARLKDEKRCLDAASELARRATWAVNLRQYGDAAERDRTDRIAKSKPVTDDRAEKRSEGEDK